MDDYSGPFNPTWQRVGMRRPTPQEEEEERRLQELFVGPRLPEPMAGNLAPFAGTTSSPPIISGMLQKLAELPSAAESLRKRMESSPGWLPTPRDERAVESGNLEEMFPPRDYEPPPVEQPGTLESMFPPPEGGYPPNPPEPTAWESRVSGIPMAGEGTGRVPGVFQGGVPTPESEAFNLANMRRPSGSFNAVDQLRSRRADRMGDPDMLAAQEAAWQRDQERKRNLYEGIRGFSESLGNFRPVSPGEILLGWKNEAPPYVAETARRELARQGDMISPSQRAMIGEAWGMNLPAEARWSQVSGVLPFVSSAIRGGASDAYRWAEHERKMMQGSRAMDLREQSMDLARNRLGLSRESFERLPSAIVTKVSSAVKARAKLNELEQNFAANADFHDNVGPIWARLQEIARYGGVNNPEFTRYSALLRDAVSEYLTLQTGAQRGMVEVWWITQALPKVTDSKETFQALMEDWKKRLDFEIDSISRTYGAAGWNTSWIPGLSQETPGMGTAAPGPSTAPAPSAGSYNGPTVRMVDPDTGAQQDIPEHNVPIAEGRGWRRF